MKYLLFLLCVLLINHSAWAQEDTDYNKQINTADIDSVNWDSLNNHIQLNELNVYSLKLNTDLEKKYYVWLKRRVNDVYPILEKAVTEYYLVTDSANQITNKKQRRKYIKKRYKELADTYEDRLKRLSTSRGQILSKLIYKETGKTTYQIIKELRGGMSAFLWNTAGGAFNIDLKQEFDPRKSREDLFLQVIIQRGIAAGKYAIIDKNPTQKKERLKPIIKALGRPN